MVAHGECSEGTEAEGLSEAIEGLLLGTAWLATASWLAGAVPTATGAGSKSGFKALTQELSSARAFSKRIHSSFLAAISKQLCAREVEMT